MDKKANDDLIAVYLIVNGSLEMSAGKIAAQTFQAAQRLLDTEECVDEPKREMLRKWREQGTRTITRVAKTEALFERAREELDCVVMIDEGMTEVPPDSATVIATYPVLRGNLPRMLRHKRVPLMQQAA